MRTLRDLHEYTANFYSISIAAIFFACVLFISGHGITFHRYFDSTDYLIYFTLSLAGVFTVNTRTIALKYGPASSTSIYSYLVAIIVLIVDVFLFDTSFTVYQAISIAVIFIATVVFAWIALT